MLTQATVNGTRGVFSDVSLVHDVQLFQSLADTYISIEADWPVMVVIYSIVDQFMHFCAVFLCIYALLFHLLLYSFACWFACLILFAMVCRRVKLHVCSVVYSLW